MDLVKTKQQISIEDSKLNQGKFFTTPKSTSSIFITKERLDKELRLTVEKLDFPNGRCFQHLARRANKLFMDCLVHYVNLEKHVNLFDYSPELPSNGYRILLKMFADNCCKRLLKVFKDLNCLNSLLFKSKMIRSVYSKDLKAWIQLLDKLEIILETAWELQKIQLSRLKPLLLTDLNSLESGSMIEKNLLCLCTIHQEVFHGRVTSFQFNQSSQFLMHGLVVSLASFGDGHNAYLNKSKTKTATYRRTRPTMFGPVSLIPYLRGFIKYSLDPDLRAQKVSQIMMEEDIDFFKEFWHLPESHFVHFGSSLITQPILVNKLKHISLSTPLRLPMITETGEESPSNFVTINPPQTSRSGDSIRVRILSSSMRNGMEKLFNLKRCKFSCVPQSRHLILHAHGGGFLAHTSKSHQIYLKSLCNDLNMPIVSIDYSLSPEHPFPRASEECFYVYAWCLLNKDKLGWTGESIICIGDSAGGLLITNIAQRAIMNQIRVPNAIIPIYTPFLLNLGLSPSRLMSVTEPLLNMGALWRCMAAYYGIKDKEAEKRNFQNNFVSANSRQLFNDLHDLIGDSAYLVESIRRHPFSTNSLMSPILAEDTILAKFPTTLLISCEDPCLDDNIEMAKRLRELRVQIKLFIVNSSIPHGFLNMKSFSSQTINAYEQIVKIIRTFINENKINK